MRHSLKLLIVGCGNMGEQLVDKWSEIYDVSVIETNIAKKKQLINKNIRVLENKNINQQKFDYIVLSVKPKDFERSLKNFSSCISHDQKIISIMAGLNIKYIKKIISVNVKVIRVMPNLYSGLGHGISGIFSEAVVKKKEIGKIMAVLGQNLWLKKESDLDFITAFFGGAPAYFFLFLNILSKVLKKKKISSSLENTLILKLLSGTQEYLKKNKGDFDFLISKVASKDGTTEEALNYLNNKNQFFNLINNAIDMATKKSKKLRNKFN